MATNVPFNIEASDRNADWLKAFPSAEEERELHAALSRWYQDGQKEGSWVTIEDRPLFIGGPGQGGGGAGGAGAHALAASQEVVDFDNIPCTKPDTEDVRAWARDQYDEWLSSLSDEEREALESYSGYTYASVNGVLRGTTAPRHVSESMQAEVDRTVEELDRCLDRSQTPRDMVLYRGLGYTMPSEFKNLKPGDKIKDHGYMSASMIEGGGRAFSMKTVAAIEVPRGTKGGLVSPFSNLSEECEILLKRGTTIEFLGRGQSPHTGKDVMRFRVVGQE